MTPSRFLARTVCISVLLAVTIGVAGCGDRASGPSDRAGQGEAKEAETARFSYALREDVSGYYMPIEAYRSGNWVLRNIFIGQAADFASWQAGSRTPSFAPIMLEFEDVTSPMVASEIGEVRSGQIRILPSGYTISEDVVMFEGQDQTLGRITLSARLDLDELATSRRNLGDDGAVLEGRLATGTRSSEGVRFRWWAGD